MKAALSAHHRAILQVLNMKPVETLGMIEEAAGTRMFELKKQQSIKIMAKKEAKLEEIQRVGGFPPSCAFCVLMFGTCATLLAQTDAYLAHMRLTPLPPDHHSSLTTTLLRALSASGRNGRSISNTRRSSPQTKDSSAFVRRMSFTTPCR